MTTAYPLSWPQGKPRAKSQRYSAFGPRTFGQARDFLLGELKRLGARHVVLSTNMSLRQDGLPLANARMPEDKGVAVYFMWDGRQMAFACDQWVKIEENIYAIAKTIEAMRGIERWGSGDMMRAAFSGFEALPPPSSEEPWHVVLGVMPTAPMNTIDNAYKSLAKLHHPDVPQGNADKMSKINRAYEQAKKEQDR